MKEYKDINLRFASHPLTKDLVKVAGDNAIKQAVKTLVLTSFYERPFHPERGSNVKMMLFETANKFTSYLVTDAIRRVINDNEPRVKIRSIVVSPNDDEISYSVTLSFFVLNSANDVTLQFLLKRS